MDIRYYAEPTTKLHRGSKLVKGQTPYSILFPNMVRDLMDTYSYFSGSKRLRRLGADLLEGSRDSGNDNHGHWGLVPSSIRLFPCRCRRGPACTRRERT